MLESVFLSLSCTCSAEYLLSLGTTVITMVFPVLSVSAIFNIQDVHGVVQWIALGLNLPAAVAGEFVVGSFLCGSAWILSGCTAFRPKTHRLIDVDVSVKDCVSPVMNWRPVQGVQRFSVSPATL